MNPWVDALAGQMRRSWKMLRLVVQRIPDGEWYEGAKPEQVPAKLAYHAVICADYYARPDDRPLVARIYETEYNPDPKKRPNRKKLRLYIDEVEARIDSLLRNSSEEALLGANTCKWTGANLYERMIYVLRHNHQHIGELQEITRERGLRPGGWR